MNLKFPLFDSPAIPIFENVNGVQHKFYSSDTEENFEISKKNLGPSWKYYEKEIIYKFNSIGSRSPEVSSISDNNFFIAYGCSHTEGIGINEEDRYSDILSSKYNLKYLNFGQGGTSHNYMWINNILGIKNIKFKPKFVICQWSEISRIVLMSDDGYNLDLITPITYEKHHKTVVSKFYKNLVMIPEFYRLQTLGYYHSINQMWNNIGVPVVHFTLDQETHEVLGIKKFTTDFSDSYNLARDLHHPGYNMNLEFANYIEKELNLNNEK